MKWHKKILLSIVVVQLAGCSSLNSQFDCPMRPGVHCESLDQVNSRVDRGEIAYESRKISFSPIRKPETVLPVWIAPYEDTDGNYHQASEVYAIVKPGYWPGHPPKVITSDEV